VADQNPRSRKVGLSIGGAVLALAAGLVAHWEGKREIGYADIIGIPTICYGHTGPDVQIGQRKTPAECEILLREDLAEANAAVRRCVHASLQPHEEAALTSFTFNVGTRAFCQSTLVRRANSGLPFCDELDRWVYAGGKLRNGLVNRRRQERRMCEGKSWM